MVDRPLYSSPWFVYQAMADRCRANGKFLLFLYIVKKKYPKLSTVM